MIKEVYISDYEEAYEDAINELLELMYSHKQLTTSELIAKVDTDGLDTNELRRELTESRLDEIFEDLYDCLDDEDATLEWVEKEWSPDLDEEDKDLMFEDMMIAIFDITEILENTLDQIKLITA
jgi:hypothetical protein